MAHIIIDMTETSDCTHMIKNLIFDFGKVLVDYDFFHTIRRYFKSDEDLQEFATLFTSLDFLNRCDREDIPFFDLIQESQQKYPKFEFQLQKFYEEYVQFVTGEIPGMKDLLVKLRQEGFRLYGLTNWCSKVHEVMQHWEILRMLDGVVISSDEKLIKPDAAIYLRLCEKFGLNAEECLFTDDRVTNVEGAQKVGMQGIVFENAEQFEHDLREILSSLK